MMIIHPSCVSREPTEETERIGKLFGLRTQETEEHWVSISDVMAGLMVIFLLIAISYMVNADRHRTNAERESNRIKGLQVKIEDLLGAYKNLQAQLSEELQAEFEGTPTKRQLFRTKWRGYLDIESLSIRFGKPFTQGEATVPNAFKNVLRDFFPRYVAILTKPEYRDGIAEIRIEGHTSSEWFLQVARDEAYINNMELSQNRARNVLHYVLQIGHPGVIQNREWLKKKLTANGLSSSQLIPDLVGNRSPVVNPYDAVRRETGIPAELVRQLHRQVLREVAESRGNENITIADIVESVAAIQRFAHLKPETRERVVNLLMENQEASRRVEFRVVTESEKLIDEIKELLEEFNQ